VNVQLRPALPDDAPALWRLFQQVILDGTTFAPDERTREEDFLRDWRERGGEQWVAVDDVRLLGAYTLRPNQPGRGAHVATASYLVDAGARGRGIGRLLGTHSIERASALGFAAIQFNFVVSTNAPAVHLWKSLGFSVLATLPRAFNHRTLGRVDAYVMWRSLSGAD
jgi:ribosomal protein S18 acetylase RimI-like enzyme